jgi:hypothetical protein
MSTTPTPTASDLPYPLLMNALTGASMPAVPLANLAGLSADLPGAEQRIANSKHLGTDYSVDDPNDLTQAGWAVIFASDADAAVKAQLQPLLDLRQKQVQDPNLFKVFEGPANGGVLPGQTAASWAQQRGVALTAPVDPCQGGVPYYLLIVGSPDRIPFEFQALLKMQWAVGRLSFDDVEDYGRYAQAVVQYESPDFKPVQRKNAAVWVTRNYGDIATAMLSGAVCQDFLAPARAPGGQSKLHLHAPTRKPPSRSSSRSCAATFPAGRRRSSSPARTAATTRAPMPPRSEAIKAHWPRRNGRRARRRPGRTSSAPTMFPPMRSSKAPWHFSSPVTAPAAPQTTTTASSRMVRRFPSRPRP